MRNLTRRGFVAGAFTVLAPLAITTPVFAKDKKAVPTALPGPADLNAISDDVNLVSESASTAVAKSVSGQDIVDFALTYVGYPYYAGGNTPAGFDCSGFTQFVILNTLGIDIGHAVEGQPGHGPSVDYNAWQPGDIVFFQNTYRAGISHASIYVADGQIVHAQNEATGVCISSLWSDYYAPRYWGAMRLV